MLKAQDSAPCNDPRRTFPYCAVAGLILSPTASRLLAICLYLVAVIGLVALCTSPSGADGQSPTPSESESVSAYLPTPPAVVEKMLQITRVQPNEKVYDLGSGDGRIVIMAAQKFGARGYGIELKPELCLLARSRIQTLALEGRVTIIEGSFFDEDLSSADVITVFLEPSALPRVRKHLEKFMHHGMRIVVCEGEIPGWTPAEVTSVLDPETKRKFRLTVYEVSRAGDWISFGNFGTRKSESSESPSLRPEQ